MVSIAVGLLLMLGVNTIFTTTSQTVGAGSALLQAGRDGRSVLQTFLGDLSPTTVVSVSSPTSPAPFFIIRSDHVAAFRDVNDKLAATDKVYPDTDSNLFGDPTRFIANQLAVPYIHFRSHRIDRMAFFSRSFYTRLTAPDDNAFSSSTAGTEALNIYGHAMQPNSASYAKAGAPVTWYGPGALDTSATNKNDNNAFASDWILSRMSFLLIPSPSDPDYFVDVPNTLSPVSCSMPTTQSFSGLYTLDSSRLDVMQTSINSYFSKPGGISVTDLANPKTGKTGGTRSAITACRLALTC